MTRKATPKRQTPTKKLPAKKADAARQPRKSKSKGATKTKSAASAASRKRTNRARSGAASSAVLGLVSGSDVLPRTPAGPSRSRKQRKGVTVYLAPAQKDLLDKIAAHHAITLQDLGLEAFDLLFAKYAKAQSG